MAVTKEHVALHGAPVTFRAAGNGRPVVLVHGLGLSSRIYERNCAELAGAGFRVIAPDLPGFGGTPGPRGGSSVGESARWLIEFAGALGVDHAVWIGHSISCQSVLALAAEAPHRADAIVLIAPTGAPGSARRVKQFLKFVRNAPREPLWAVREVARDYLSTSPAKYMGTWLKGFRDHPVGRLPAIQCPALVVIGARDPVVPRSYISMLATGIRDATVAVIPGGAHGVPFDRRSEMDARIIAWLRALPLRGSVGAARPHG